VATPQATETVAVVTLTSHTGISDNWPAYEESVMNLIHLIGRSSALDGLTETERRVAALVAQGRTNREVATAMFVTENTVQTHLRHIFRKLGIRSRTELAIWLLSIQAGSAAYERSSAE
jgi:DNA-binding CsgD family transcriptional regulator